MARKYPKNVVKVNNLKPNDKYLVQVRGTDGNGNYTKWSKTYVLKTTDRKSGIANTTGFPEFTVQMHIINETTILAGPGTYVYVGSGAEDSGKIAFKFLYVTQIFETAALIDDIGYQPFGVDNVPVSIGDSGSAVGTHWSAFVVTGGGGAYWARTRMIFSDGTYGDWHWPSGE